MERINSKRKGSAFELQIAHFLTNIDSSPWYRVGISSGARATTQGLQNGFQGDVFSPDHKDLVVECKHWRFLTISDLFNTKSDFFKAIRQSETEAQGKEWLLFIKANNHGTLLVHKLFMEQDTHTMLEKVKAKGFMTITTGLLKESYKVTKICRKE